MGSALRCDNIVYKAVTAFCVGIIMLNRYFNIDVILCSLAINNLRIKRHTAFIQILNILFNTALIMKCAFLFFLLPQIRQIDF